MATTSAVTEWDAQGNPITPTATASPAPRRAVVQPRVAAQPLQPAQAAQPAQASEWDAQGNPIHSAPPSYMTGTQPTTVRDPNDIDTSTWANIAPIKPGDGFFTRAAKNAVNVAATAVKPEAAVLQGVGQGVFGTALGADNLVRKGITLAGGNGGEAGATLQELAGQTPGTDHGAAYSPQNIGHGLEDVGEFLLGDELLKGAVSGAANFSRADAMMNAAKKLKMIEDSPILTRLLVRGVTGGIVGGAEAGIKSGGDADATVSGALGGAVGNALIPEVGTGARRVGEAVADNFTSKAGQAVGKTLQAAGKLVGGSAKPGDPLATVRASASEPGYSQDEIDANRDHVQEQFHSDIQEAAEKAANAKEVPAPANEVPVTTKKNEPIVITSAKPIDVDEGAASYVRNSKGQASDQGVPKSTAIAPATKSGQVLKLRELANPNDPQGWFSDGGFVGDGRGITDDQGNEYIDQSKRVNLNESPKFLADEAAMKTGHLDVDEFLKRVRNGVYDVVEPPVRPQDNDGFRYQAPSAQSPRVDFTKPVGGGPAFAEPDPTFNEQHGRRAGDVPSTGVAPPPQPFTLDPNGSPRDAFGQAARHVYNASKADFATIDKASGYKWQVGENRIDALERAMRNVTDDDEYDALMDKKNAMMTAQSQLIENLAGKNLIDPKMADRAVSNYQQAMAMADVDKAIKMSSTHVPSPGRLTRYPGDIGIDRLANIDPERGFAPGQDIIDPNKLGPRLQKLADIPTPRGGDSRLAQAKAEGLLEATNRARFFMDTKGIEPTGKAALEDLIGKNTSSTPYGKKTDFVGLLKNLDKVDVDRLFGVDAPQVKAAIQKAALQQSTAAARSEFIKRYLLPGGLIGGAAFEGGKALYDRTVQNQ